MIRPPDLARLTLAAACWGLGTVISKRAVAEIPPLTLLAIQLAVSLAVLALLMRLRGVSVRAEAPALLGRLGVLNPGAAYALSLLGLATISASVSVTLWAIEPLLIVLLAGWLLHEQVSRRLILLTIAAVGGMIAVAYDPSGAGTIIGVGLTLAGVGCCAVYSIVARRWLPEAESTTQVVFVQQAYALGFALVVALAVLLLGGGALRVTPSLTAAGSAVGSGALYYAGAYWFYLGALRNVPASRAVVSFYLIPIVGVASSIILLGERLQPWQWLGVAIVVGATLATVGQPEPAGSASGAGLDGLPPRLHEDELADPL